MLQTTTLLIYTLISLSAFVQTQRPAVSLTGGRPRLLVGMPFELRCDATAAGGAANVQWERNNVLLAAAVNGFSVSQRGDVSLLTKDAIEETDSADYTCAPTVPNVDSANTQLTVFDIRPFNAELEKEHSTVTLRCVVVSLAGTYPMQWQRAGKDIAEMEDKYIIDANNNTLTIQKVETTEIGEYTCGITLADNETFKRKVIVSAKVHIRPFDKSKNLIEGDRLSLNCQAWGYPLPVITWYKNHLPIDDSDPRISFADLNNMENATLRIENLQFSDRADYNCNATNELGRADSTVILIRVKDKLAALWPFLGICAEVIILCVIIWVYERRHAKKLEEEDNREEADHLTNSHDHKGNDEIRQRK